MTLCLDHMVFAVKLCITFAITSKPFVIAYGLQENNGDPFQMNTLYTIYQQLSRLPRRGWQVGRWAGRQKTSTAARGAAAPSRGVVVSRGIDRPQPPLTVLDGTRENPLSLGLKQLHKLLLSDLPLSFWAKSYEFYF